MVEVIERAWLSSGGDIVEIESREVFRLDVENHGKTAAFLKAFDVKFAVLAELQQEKDARPVDRAVPNVDGLSPNGARKTVQTLIPRPREADAVYGAVWYDDVFGNEHVSRFLLRIAPRRDIPGEGLTRLDVQGVAADYWLRD